jgi:hypothetical protein
MKVNIIVSEFIQIKQVLKLKIKNNMFKQNKECVFEPAVTANFTRAHSSEITFSLYDSLATSTIHEILTY